MAAAPGPSAQQAPWRVRLARADDLPAIVAMLADDPLGAQREDTSSPLPPAYRAAFDASTHDPHHHELVVAETADGQPVAVLQLTFTPTLTHQGGWRASIEGVRVASHCRGLGLGRQLLSWAVGRAHERGCRVVQLTTDKRRADARRFYESLGFVATHEGMKLSLPRPPHSP
jgi:ribosomal protein S18 acetylase RimI-like enzyme